MKNKIAMFFSVIIVLVGLGLMSGGMYLTMAPYIQPKIEKKQAELKSEAIKICKANSEKIGWHVAKESDGLAMSMLGSSEDWKRHLSRSSTALMTCPSFELTEFCYGPECIKEYKALMFMKLTVKNDIKVY